MDEARFQVRYAGAPVTLTRQEFRLLALLVRTPGRVFTREQMLDRVWEDGGTVTDRAIDAHIKTVRRKLAEAAVADPTAAAGMIETVRGIGYKARENVSA